MTNKNSQTRSIDLYVEMEKTLQEFETSTTEERYAVGVRVRLITDFAQKIGGMSLDEIKEYDQKYLDVVRNFTYH